MDGVNGVLLFRHSGTMETSLNNATILYFSPDVRVLRIRGTELMASLGNESTGY